MIVKEKDLSGKTLSNYKIVNPLGRGGMATVYKAHELSLNRMVALKVLSSQLSEDKEYIKRFQREAQAAAQLNHPNIVQIYSIGEEKGVHYFAMEYIKGKSLAQVKKEVGVMMPDKAVTLIRQVADALSDAHKSGLVHRDIKPSNIMIDSLGRAKVTDFGIAYVSNAQTKLTREGSIIGTPEYLSPEQCEGKTVDQRSDVYSLGVTLYELLTGKTPYEADTPVSMLMKIVKGEFPPICEVNTNIPEELCKVVEKMMETDVNKRYATMKEVLADLAPLNLETSGMPVKTATPETRTPAEASTSPEPVTTPVPAPGTVGEPAAVERKSNKWAAFIVAAVIVLLMGGAFAAKILIFDKKKEDSPKPDHLPAISEKATVQDDQASDVSEKYNDAPPDETGNTNETAETTDHEGDSSGSQTNVDTTNKHSVSASMGQSSGKLKPGIDNTATQTTQHVQDHSSKTPSQASTQLETAVKPGSSTSKSIRRSTSAKVLPPVNSCLVTAMGDSDKADVIGAYVQEILGGKNYTVVDGPSVAAEKISTVARKHIVVTSRSLGTTTLNYYGNSSEQYTVAITAKVVSAQNGTISAGPVTQTVKYTAINAEENIKEAVAKLVAALRL